MGNTKIETAPFDSADYLETPEDIAAYLAAAFEEGDPQMIPHAIGVDARAQGMTGIATATGLSRESLYRALSEGGNPQLSTIMKVLEELGLRLTVEPCS